MVDVVGRVFFIVKYRGLCMRLVIDNRRDFLLAIVGVTGQIGRTELEAMVGGSRDRVKADVAYLIREKFLRVSEVENRYLAVNGEVVMSADDKDGFREMMILGLVGYEEKIRQENLLRALPEKDRKYNLAIGKLLKQKKLKTVGGEGEKVLRLTLNKGVERLKEIDQYLYWHYQNFTGGHRFDGNENFKKRNKKQSDLMRYFVEQNMEVDFLRLEYEQNKIGRHKKEKAPLIKFNMVSEVFSSDKHLFEKDGSLKPYGELLVLVEPHRQYFFSSKALRSITKFRESDEGRAMMYRIYGVMLGENNFYPVYYLESSKEEWFETIESEMRTVIEAKMEGAWTFEEIKKRQRRFPTGSSITYMKKNNLLVEILERNQKEKKSKYFFPPAIYSGAHMLPMNENEKDIRKMLLSRDWDLKLNKRLYDQNSISAAKGYSEDAIVNGISSWEFLSCNATKLVEIFKFIIGREKVIIVIHPWQKPQVEKNN